MKTQFKFDLQMLNKAFDFSKKSKAEKRKVGAVIVDMATESIISSGYNKMFDYSRTNDCENHLGDTYECVIHAEELAVINMFKLPEYSQIVSKHLKTIFCTYSPCMNCCKLIAHAGITKVVYFEEHKTNFVTREIVDGFSPKEFLQELGIEIVKYNKSTVFNTVVDFKFVRNTREKLKPKPRFKKYDNSETI